MNLRDIRSECWDIARETATNDQDRLWSTSEMNRYINRTYRQIARETRCIKDAQTVSLCLLDSPVVDYTTLTPGTMDYIWANDPNSWLYHKDVTPFTYPLDPVILDVDEVKWTTRQWRLTKVSVKKWQVNPWWEQVIGMPTEFCTDYSNNTLTLNFRSEVADTMRLIVRRLPIVDLILDTDIPEFRTHYHDFIRFGVLEQMYSKQDSQAFDATKATEFGTRFKADLDEIKQSEAQLDERLRPNHSTAAFR